MQVPALALTLTLTLLAQGASDDPAARLARRIEQHQLGARDLVARFTQTYRSGLLGRRMVETGTLSLKRPGRMRWEYLEPEQKTFVSDGRTFYFYVPEDRQVIVRDQAGDKRTPAMLLAGEADLLGEFQASLAPAPPGRERLRLTPREPDPELREVLVDVDGRDRIVGIEVLDAQGNLSSFSFEDIRENVGLTDELFDFEIPSGVEVVSG